MHSVVVVDYGIVNLKNIVRGLEHVGASVHSTADYKRVLNADRIVLPGVGSFPSGMGALIAAGMDDALKTFATMDRPILGICLGMQMLLESSEEHGRRSGLGLFKGSVLPVPSEIGKSGKRKIPHVGWSALNYSEQQTKWNGTCLERLQPGTFCYFSHSFMAVPENPDDILAIVNYEGACIASALQTNNVMGIQFHPELSGPAGLKILEQFITM